jgi:hypothetical protein
MKDECIFCKKNHFKLDSSFEEFILKNNLDSEEIISFMELLKKELAANHWNEVFCMINTVSRFNLRPKNTLQVIFLTTVKNIQNCIISNPKMTKIQKYIKNLTIEIKRIEEEQKLDPYRKKTEPNDFNIEMKRFIKIFEVLNKKTHVKNCEKCLDIDVQLKNYIIYRLISFFEFKIVDTLTRAIDGRNQNSRTYGKELLRDDKAIQKKINYFVILFLQEQNFKSQNNEFSLNFEAQFMKFLNEIIQISNSDLKKYFEDEHQSDWITFLTNIKQNRNLLTHEFTDVTYSLKELKSILNLMQIFCFIFPYILKILGPLTNQQTMDQETIKENLLELNKLEQLNAKVVDTDSFFNLFQQHFDKEQYKKIQKLEEENFKKNKQEGVFLGYTVQGNSGFIKRKGDRDLYVRRKDVAGSIKKGDPVEYLLGVDKDGKPVAKNLRESNTI